MRNVLFLQGLAHLIPVAAVASVAVNQQHRQCRGVTEGAFVELTERQADGGTQQRCAEFLQKQHGVFSRGQSPGMNAAAFIWQTQHKGVGGDQCAHPDDCDRRQQQGKDGGIGKPEFLDGQKQRGNDAKLDQENRFCDASDHSADCT